jgi:hypothetical protein
MARTYQPRRKAGWYKTETGRLVRCRIPERSEQYPALWIVRYFEPRFEPTEDCWKIATYVHALTWKRVPPSRVPPDWIERARRALREVHAITRMYHPADGEGVVAVRHRR